MSCCRLEGRLMGGQWTMLCPNFNFLNAASATTRTLGASESVVLHHSSRSSKEQELQVRLTAGGGGMCVYAYALGLGLVAHLRRALQLP